MTQDLIESFEAGIATLTMNRPEARNAFSRAMMDALSEALPRLAVDPAVRLVVVTGTGNAFCAGGDVKGFAKNVGRRAGRHRPSTPRSPTCARAWKSRAGCTRCPSRRWR